MSEKTYTSAKMIREGFIAAHDKYRLSLYNMEKGELITRAGEIYAEKRIAKYLIDTIDYSGDRPNRVVDTLLGKGCLDWADYMNLVSGFARVMVDPDLINEGGVDDILEDVVNERDEI